MSAATYYNEFDRGAAAWLRELASNGLIAQGYVDERSIAEVKAADLDSYSRCHWFAGIGGWDYALQLAGWPTTRPVWTASCPCQPFSAAGKRKGTGDERHLWPVLSALIRECRPDCVFGEQVGGVAGYEWLDGIRADLESQGYTFGAADLAAAGVGSPHIRQRLFWVANAASDRAERNERGKGAARGTRRAESGRCCPVNGVADAERAERRPHGELHAEESGREQEATKPRGSGISCRLGGDSANERHERERDARRRRAGLEEASGTGGMGNASSTRSQERVSDGRVQWGTGVANQGQAAKLRGPWSDCDLIPCRDGKCRRVPRRVESGVLAMVDGLPLELGGMWVDGYGVHPLASGVKGRVGLLRGAGNAIVPQVAAVFIRAFLDATASQERAAA